MSASETPEDEPDCETPAGPTEPGESLKALIEMRIQKLYNRRFLLQQMQQVFRKTEDRQRNSEIKTSEEDDEDPSELELVEKELEELLRQKENLENPNAAVNGDPVCFNMLTCKTETPEGGVYTLPPLLVTQDIVPLLPIDNSLDDEPTEETVTPPSPEETIPSEEAVTPPVPEDTTPSEEAVTPPVPEDTTTSEEQEDQGPECVDVKEIQAVDTLGKDGAFTQCPSCEELVFTQTRKFNGDSVWLMCCICCMLGGFVGFCLIPFCLDKLKSVQHKCPQCQAVIHTYHPF